MNDLYVIAYYIVFSLIQSRKSGYE